MTKRKLHKQKNNRKKYSLNSNSKKTQKEIKKIKLYGGIGQLLIVLTISLLPIISIVGGFFHDVFNNPMFIFLNRLFNPTTIFILFIFGNILVIASVKKISNLVYQEKQFTKFLIFYLLSFFLTISTTIIFFIFLALGFGAAMSDTPVPGINAVLLILISSAIFVFLLSFFFYKKSLLIIYKLTRKKLFKFSGNLILLGGVFLISSLITLFLTSNNKNMFFLYLAQ